MNRKVSKRGIWIAAIIILLVAIFLFWTGGKHNKFFTSVDSLGTVYESPNTKLGVQKVVFNGTVTNHSSIPTYVNEVTFVFDKGVQNRFRSGDNVVKIDEWIMPGEQKGFKGSWTLSTAGLKEGNLSSLSRLGEFEVSFGFF
ncbi:hypothetical protein [Paenibacillus sp. SN-8-1]|uniref:hypothetical protein n=1 Tax=Paenibacillus sp. SN-8-1 TaxID=3435409 RepID=UPI003D9A8E68